MKTLLYVEDHPPARLLMQAIVAELTPFRLEVAENGADARRIAAALKPDLYLLDLDLPDTDGRLLASALVALHRAPVILISAYAEAVDLQAEAAHVGYLAKPLDPDHVADTLKRILAG